MEFEEFYGRFCEGANVNECERRSDEFRNAVMGLYHDIHGEVTKSYEISGIAKAYLLGKEVSSGAFRRSGSPIGFGF